MSTAWAVARAGMGWFGPDRARRGGAAQVAAQRARTANGLRRSGRGARRPSAARVRGGGDGQTRTCHPRWVRAGRAGCNVGSRGVLPRPRLASVRRDHVGRCARWRRTHWRGRRQDLPAAGGGRPRAARGPCLRMAERRGVVALQPCLMRISLAGRDDGVGGPAGHRDASSAGSSLVGREVGGRVGLRADRGCEQTWMFQPVQLRCVGPTVCRCGQLAAGVKSSRTMRPAGRSHCTGSSGGSPAAAAAAAVDGEQVERTSLP